jgi:hypothetical protein
MANYDDIKKALEQRGFYENADFIFVGMNNETDFMFDGVPMYRIANYQNDETTIYFEPLKRDLTLHVIRDLNMGTGGQTSSNNDVQAVYIPKQGFIFTKAPEIKWLMEKEFNFKDTHFGIPLSNGAIFRDDKQQKIWEQIQFNCATKQITKETTNKKLNPNLMKTIGEQTIAK